MLENAFLILAGTTLTARFLESFKEFPPRQEAATFSIDQVVEKLEMALASGR
jgi:arylsulfatase